MTTKTLLIVDDSLTARLLIKAMFEELHPDWTYLMTGNGDEALELINNTPVDYFSIDYNMPDKNGIELIEQIRKHNQTSPIILLTANIQPQLATKADALKVLCLYKPLTDKIIQQAASYFTHE